MDPRAHLSGVQGVLIHRSQWDMITNNEGLIHLRCQTINILVMGAIRSRCLQEVALVLVGSKGHIQACKGPLHIVLVMIIMEGKEVMQYLLHFLLPFQGHYLPQQWFHPITRLITIMGNHKVRNMGILVLMPRQLLSRTMDICMKSLNMKIMVQCSNLMEDMEVLSNTPRLVVIQDTPHNSSMVSQLMECRDRRCKIMALLELVNLGIFLIKDLFHQVNHMAQMLPLNSNTHMHLVDLCSQLIHMALYHSLMATVSHHLQLVKVIPSKVASMFLVTARLVDSRQVMDK